MVVSDKRPVSPNSPSFSDNSDDAPPSKRPRDNRYGLSLLWSFLRRGAKDTSVSSAKPKGNARFNPRTLLPNPSITSGSGAKRQSLGLYSTRNDSIPRNATPDMGHLPNYTNLYESFKASQQELRTGTMKSRIYPSYNDLVQRGELNIGLVSLGESNEHSIDEANIVDSNLVSCMETRNFERGVDGPETCIETESSRDHESTPEGIHFERYMSGNLAEQDQCPWSDSRLCIPDIEYESPLTDANADFMRPPIINLDPRERYQLLQLKRAAEVAALEQRKHVYKVDPRETRLVRQPNSTLVETATQTHDILSLERKINGKRNFSSTAVLPQYNQRKKNRSKGFSPGDFVYDKVTTPIIKTVAEPLDGFLGTISAPKFNSQKLQAIDFRLSGMDRTSKPRSHSSFGSKINLTLDPAYVTRNSDSSKKWNVIPGPSAHESESSTGASSNLLFGSLLIPNSVSCGSQSTNPATETLVSKPPIVGNDQFNLLAVADDSLQTGGQIRSRKRVTFDSGNALNVFSDIHSLQPNTIENQPQTSGEISIDTTKSLKDSNQGSSTSKPFSFGDYLSVGTTNPNLINSSTALGRAPSFTSVNSTGKHTTLQEISDKPVALSQSSKSSLAILSPLHNPKPQTRCSKEPQFSLDKPKSDKIKELPQEANMFGEKALVLAPQPGSDSNKEGSELPHQALSLDNSGDSGVTQKSVTIDAAKPTFLFNVSTSKDVYASKPFNLAKSTVGDLATSSSKSLQSRASTLPNSMDAPKSSESNATAPVFSFGTGSNPSFSFSNPVSAVSSIPASRLSTPGLPISAGLAPPNPSMPFGLHAGTAGVSPATKSLFVTSLSLGVNNSSVNPPFQFSTGAKSVANPFGAGSSPSTSQIAPGSTSFNFANSAMDPASVIGSQSKISPAFTFGINSTTSNPSDSPAFMGSTSEATMPLTNALGINLTGQATGFSFGTNSGNLFSMASQSGQSNSNKMHNPPSQTRGLFGVNASQTPFIFNPANSIAGQIPQVPLARRIATPPGRRLAVPRRRRQ